MKILSTGNLVMGRPCCFNNGQFRISAYNFQCRMTSQTDIDGSVFAYEFDGEGNRLSQSLNDCLSKRFVYDGADVLLELNPTNGVAYAWVNGPGIDQPIERLLFIDGTPRARRIFHADALGSIAALTDPDGFATQSYTYAAFGSLRSSAGPDRNRVTFTGREQLGGGGELLYYRHRIYNPVVGRFMSADPLGFMDGVNQYVIVGNKPVDCTDPDELFSAWVVGAIGAGVNVLTYSVGSCLMNKPVTKGGLVGAAVSGFVSGAIVGALTGDVTAMGAVAAIGAVAGGMGAVSGSACQQAIDNRTVSKRQLRADGVLGVAGGIAGGISGVAIGNVFGAKTTQALSSGVGVALGVLLQSTNEIFQSIHDLWSRTQQAVGENSSWKYQEF